MNDSNPLFNLLFGAGLAIPAMVFYWQITLAFLLVGVSSYVLWAKIIHDPFPRKRTVQTTAVLLFLRFMYLAFQFGGHENPIRM